MTLTQTFMEQYLAGKVTADQVDDFVAKWHETQQSMPLHSYLGLTEEQYNHWVVTNKLPSRLNE